MAENGSGEDSKRDERGRFLSGCAGGPGRGKKSDEYDLSDADFWEATEKVIRRDMESSNDSTRMKATGLYMKWKAMKDEFERREKAEGQGGINQDFLDLINLLMSLRKNGMKVSDVIAKMVEVCPGCKRLGEASALDTGYEDIG